MMTFTLQHAAKIVAGITEQPSCVYEGVNVDSRHVQPGELFVAIPGKQTDGHHFLAMAAARGASAALVETTVADAPLPTLQVQNTVTALGQLATAWRQRFTLPVLAVTGSNGKTTTRTMIAHILQTASSPSAVLSPTANFNTLVGLPLTLASLNAQHRFAVIEMGMNQFGEIATLTRCSQPSVGIVTNAGPAHLKNLGNVASVAIAKGELFANLADDACCIINADDPFAATWLTQLGQRHHLTFAFDNPHADVYATDYTGSAMHSDFTLHHQHHQRAIHLPLPGKHNVYNALAAASACLAIDIPLTTIQHALQHMPTVKQRLQHHISAQGAYILDDTYNANPASVSAGLDVLASSQGETVWVFGDMGELGEDAAHLHAQLGTLATQKHITTLLTLGELSRHTHQHFVGNKQHFTDKSALLRVLQNYLNPGTTIYIKGSRFMHMEDIVHALLPTTLT